MNENIIDARGLSCPEPAMLARQALVTRRLGCVVVLVDSTTSRDNVIRTAKISGWEAVFAQQADGSFKLELTK